MIKQIQLRGISRTPSDRLTEDGGCAESLNVQTDGRELAPVIVPEDITSQYGGYQMTVTGMTGPALYIHRNAGASYDNLIYLEQENNTVNYYKKGVNRGPFVIFTLEEGETVTSVNSIGNTLIVATNLYMRYALCKGGSYTELGTQIPIPSVEFRCMAYENVGTKTKVMLDYEIQQADTTHYSINGRVARRYTPPTDEDLGNRSFDEILAVMPGAWSKVLANDDVPDKYEESFLQYQNDLWDLVKTQMTKVRKQGYFPCPVFARYALKLYDGTYIYQSVPILLGGGLGDYFTAKALVYNATAGTNAWRSQLNISLKSCFSAKAYLRDYDVSGWEDIVESLDIFISTGITRPILNSDITGLVPDTEASTSTKYYYDIVFTKDEQYLEDEANLEEVLSKRNFFKIASFKFNDNGAERLAEGYDLLSNNGVATDVFSEDYLITQAELPDDYLSTYVKTPGSLYKYNSRIMMSDISYEIAPGYDYPNGTTVKKDNSGRYAYEFRFHVKSPDNSELTVMARAHDGGFVMHEYEGSYRVWLPRGYYDVDSYCRPYAWIAYPDPECHQVDVLRYSVTESGGEPVLSMVESRTYKMEAHPGLHCAYCFIGLEGWFGKDGGESMGSIGVRPNWSRDESRHYSESNVLWASVMNNPFAFLASGKMSFLSDVIGMANATKALSEGQFGQFPLYVFTGDGVWSVPITDTGDFASSVPMSRDVALSAGSIIPIEQAVVFVTAQGVKLISGSDILAISAFMNGKHYIPEAGLDTVLAGHADLSAYADAFNDGTPFMPFVSESRVAYDYTGQRLIFFREDEKYQYVYKIDSQTWHKMSVEGQGYALVNSLNSYPDCYLCALNTSTGLYRVKNMSVVYDPSAEQTTLPALVISRPFDLGETDIRKVIRDLRIRGQFNRGDVRYILMGSFDGVNWRRLNSLRGGSYKLFRIALICTMAPTERVSWIDVDYETRFTNRLR